MYHTYPNLVPVTNRYLAEKKFLKEQEEYKKNIKNVHGLLDLSPPSPRRHCQDRLRQKQMKEYELEVIEHENQRLKTRMSANGAYVDSHNEYSPHSLNVEKRQRDEAQHRAEIKRLQKQISHTRTYYPADEYEQDFSKQLDFKRRICKHPPNNK